MSTPEQGWENRRSPRARVLGHAQIEADGRRINCVVRNLSDTGAKLGVSRHAHLPSTFVLCFVRRNLKLNVRLRWRNGDYAGVSFEAPRSLSGPRNTYVLDV